MGKARTTTVGRIASWARRWQEGVDAAPHANYDSDLEHSEEMLAQYCIEFLTSRGFFPLPTGGRSEREHLYRWISEEEIYASNKFKDLRGDHDEHMRRTHMKMDGFWFGQIVQYYDEPASHSRTQRPCVEKAKARLLALWRCEGSRLSQRR